MTKQDIYENGEVFYAFMRYKDHEDGIGKDCPVVALKDPETETWQALKITSQIDKKLNHKYGYLMEDWEQSGLTSPSIIKCNIEDIEEINPSYIRKKIGELTHRDLTGLLVKLIKVRQVEYQREQRKIRNFEI